VGVRIDHSKALSHLALLGQWPLHILTQSPSMGSPPLHPNLPPPRGEEVFTYPYQPARGEE
jgi:hypothetical protein